MTGYSFFRSIIDTTTLYRVLGINCDVFATYSVCPLSPPVRPARSWTRWTGAGICVLAQCLNWRLTRTDWPTVCGAPRRTCWPPGSTLLYRYGQKGEMDRWFHVYNVHLWTEKKKSLSIFITMSQNVWAERRGLVKWSSIYDNVHEIVI